MKHAQPRPLASAAVGNTRSRCGTRSSLSAIAAATVLVLAPGPVRSADGSGATFTGLGQLASGSRHTHVLDVSGDGSTAVGIVSTRAGSQAVRWTEVEGLVRIAGPTKKAKRKKRLRGAALLGSTADAVSFDGSVVAGSALPKGLFFWRPGPGLAPVEGLDVVSIRAAGMSADGLVVVGEVRPDRDVPRAFRWTQEDGLELIESLSGRDGRAGAVATSADGSVVVGWCDSPDGSQAFRWTAESGTVGLGGLVGEELKSVAMGVSADGSTVVGNSSSWLGQEAFRWTAESGMIGMGSLPGYNVHAVALAASANGSVIVGGSGFGEDRLAFLWDARRGMRNLHDVLADSGADVEGWVLEEAVAVSGDGRTIVGNGKNEKGRVEAWRAVLPASPGR